MASRKEQKERLRREREQRAAAAKSSSSQRLIGYAVGGAAVLIIAVIAIVLLSGGGGDDASADVLPDGGDVPEIREVDTVAQGAEIAGCELKSYRATSREHVADLAQKIRYASKPPTSGSHFQEWADDAAYETPPDIKKTVHALEHGRIVVWFKEGLPADQRAALKAYYDEDSYQMLLVPDTSGMKYQVAASAWNREPAPNGTGRLLGCPKYSDDFFTALEVFKDEHRSRGPEPVP